MDKEPGDATASNAMSELEPLARELALQVTQALARLAPDTTAARRRDRRQDLLWDCASVLQTARTSPRSPELLRALEALPDLLAEPEDEGFAAVLEGWVRETSALAGRVYRPATRSATSSGSQS